MTNITPEVALQNLYQASTLARLTAEEHKVLQQSAQVLADLLPKKEVVEAEKVETV